MPLSNPVKASPRCTRSISSRTAGRIITTHTEIYLVLEGEGHIELDGERYPVKPMTTVLIKPGCRHRAGGELKIANIPIPAFDEDDEWFD